MAMFHALLKKLRFRLHMLALALTIQPVIGGSPEGEGGEGGGSEGEGEGEGAGGEGAGSGEGEAEGGGSEGEGGEGSGEEEGAGAAGPRGELEKLRGELRKHRGTEKRAKEAEKKIRELSEKLKQREDAERSEHEKALDTAREEAKAEAESGFATTRRADKIETAVTKLASGGFKVTVKDGDEEKEKTVRFADSDDAQLRIDRALRDGDLEYDDIYGDGKVKTDAVTEFLRELLEEHPRLQASDGEKKQERKVEGDADAGKGKGASGEPSVADLVNDMSTATK